GACVFAGLLPVFKAHAGERDRRARGIPVDIVLHRDIAIFPLAVEELAGVVVDDVVFKGEGEMGFGAAALDLLELAIDEQVVADGGALARAPAVGDAGVVEVCGSLGGQLVVGAVTEAEVGRDGSEALMAAAAVVVDGGVAGGALVARASRVPDANCAAPARVD